MIISQCQPQLVGLGQNSVLIERENGKKNRNRGIDPRSEPLQGYRDALVRAD